MSGDATIPEGFTLVFAEAPLGRIKELTARCEAAGIEVAVVNNGCRPSG